MRRARQFPSFLGILFILLLPTFCYAHPVDKLQEPVPELGLDNPEFFECHFDYWHCRRNLNELGVEYSKCVGAVRTLHNMLGFPPPFVEETIVHYFDVVPAHPVVDRPGDMDNCKAHINACESSHINNAPHLEGCLFYKHWLVQTFFGISLAQ